MVIEQELPKILTGLRVLELVPPGADGSGTVKLADQHVQELIATDAPAELREKCEGTFDLILCREPFASRPHPVATLADLWWLAAPEATLLLESEILEQEAHSTLTRFLPAATSGVGWLPGRLTLRWMVEVAGFDVERWIGQPDERVDSRIALRAIRTEREPASSAP